MVGIVAVTRFCEAGNAAFSSYIDYIDRNNAVRKNNLEKFNVFSGYTEYMDDELKTIIRDEFATEKMSALFTRSKDELSDGDKAEMKKLFQTAQANGSNMWQTVISFDNAYLHELGIYDIETDTLNEKLLRQAARKGIDDMLKKEGLENATWTAAFHYNTDNIHIHIATVETVPMREKRTYTLYEKTESGDYPVDEKGKIIKKPVLDGNGEIVTYEAYKGTFQKKSIEALKSALRNELEGTREVHKDITRLLRENILADKKERVLLDTPEFTDKMLDLYRYLSESGVPVKNWHYNMNVLSGIRPKIDDLSDFFIQTYHPDDFKQFVAQIESEAEKQTAAYGGSASDYANNMLHGKEGLYARLGNAILKEIRAYDKNLKNQRNEARSAARLLNPENERFNLEKGLELLHDQAGRGNVYALNSLGLIYFRGQYVERDPDRARAYFTRSAGAGNEYAASMLRRMENRSVSGSLSSRRLYSSLSRRELRRGLKSLEQSLRNNYMKARNLQEHAELERQIKERGAEDEL